MDFYPSQIADVILLVPDVIGDDRGFFMETWRKKTLEKAGINADFVQENHSKSRQGVLRGLHYQIQNPQGKLIRVVKGAVFDVAVDLRRHKSTFGQWVGHTISAKNKHLLWIPPEFAHGFYVMTEDAEFVYKCTDYYNPEGERCIKWDDPDIGIEWPLGGTNPLVSDKDMRGTSFKEAEVF